LPRRPVFTIFEGTSEIQRMMVGRALTGSDVRPEFAGVMPIECPNSPSLTRSMPGFALARDDVRHGGAQPGQVSSLVSEFPGGPPFVERDQVLRPWQAWPRPDRM
jgi:hypothetical protein